ncbi:MAG: hypothetical protein ACE5I1_11515 [bacterium]
MANYFIVILLFIFGCRESPNTPQKEISPGPPILPSRGIIKIDFPINAPAEVDTIFSESIGDLNFVFILIEFAKDSTAKGQYPDWTWRAKASPYNMEIKAKILAENVVQWQIILDSDQVVEGPYPEDWLQSKGTITDNGKSGSFDMFEPFNANLLAQSNWSNDNNTLIINTKKDQKNYEITANPNKSGKVVVTKQIVKIFEASWDATGAGSWISYNPVTGQQTGSGTW